MGKFKFWKKEERADPAMTQFEDALLQALLGKTEMSADKAMQIPTVAGTISLIGELIASTPIKLYRETMEDGKRKTYEVTGDERVRLLNEATGDTLTAGEMWRAVVRDIFLEKGAYLYINKQKGVPKSIHYVDAREVTVTEYIDPIHKDFDIYVQGKKYYPFDFVKILRNTKNGANGQSIVQENPLILSVAYNALCFENALVKKGGNKKGFIQSAKKLSKEAMDALKEAFRNQYSNNQENVIVLNEGAEFKESSNTSVEMQLNENKTTNAAEIGKIFHVSPNLLNGTSGTVKPEEEIRRFVKLAVIPILNIIADALNRDLLKEKEKGEYYFAHDTKELLKGTAKERYETYKAGIESKVITIDEARYQEDMEPLGMDYVNLNLSDVLYNPKTKEMFVLNTNKVAQMDKLEVEGGENGEN